MRSYGRICLAALILGCFGLLTACGLGGSSSNGSLVSNPAAPTPGSGSNGTGSGATTPVTITSSAPTVPAGGSLQLSASTLLVRWQVNGVDGGNSSVGTISSSGVYTAPGVAMISAPMMVTISAVPSVLSVAGTGTFQVTVMPPTMTISPADLILPNDGSIQFQAKVTTCDDPRIVWLVNGIAGGNGLVGTINAAGLYFPPIISQTMSLRITAALAANSNLAASTTLTLNPAVLAVVSPATPALAAGGQQRFTATVQGATAPVTWLVNGKEGGDATSGTITAGGLYTAPISPNSSTVLVEASQPLARHAGFTTVTVLPPHSIAVRTTSTLAEFYDRRTGGAFTPRGNSYVRLGNLTDNFGRTQIDHTTFIVGMYDAARSEAALAAMESSGYNYTRVFLNGCCIGGSGNDQGVGLNPAYIANVVDFLTKAKVHHIQVMFTQDWLPGYGGYGELLGPCWPQFNMNNLNYLSSCGVQANAKYFRDLAQAMVAAQAPLDGIFAYELRSEYSYDAQLAPLDASSGMVTAANGQTYDLGDAASRQALMDDGLVYWADQVAAAVRGVDPTAMVTIGFFAPQGPNPYRIGDQRLIQPWPAIASSTVDYVSIHPYPIPAWAGGLATFDEYAQNFGFVGYQQTQPVVMEEFGAFTTQYSESDAATVVHDWQVRSCAYGIKGWMFWTWDTDPAEQPSPATWPASGGTGVINTALAPVNRPDPCGN